MSFTDVAGKGIDVDDARGRQDFRAEHEEMLHGAAGDVAPPGFVLLGKGPAMFMHRPLAMGFIKKKEQLADKLTEVAGSLSHRLKLSAVVSTMRRAEVIIPKDR